MDILLIQPYGSGHPPLGLCYLAASLEKGGYGNVKIIDLSESSKSPVRSIGYLEKELKKRPDIVGMTSTTATVNDAITIGRKARQYCDTIMYGGPHATIFQEKILEKIPVFDIVVYGEADNTICEIVERLERTKSLEGVNGVIYRDDGRIIKNPPSPIITDLNSIPFPSRHLLDMEDYHAASSILTSRGCPNKCTFCSHVVTGRRWRGRSPENVVDEIELLLSEYPKVLKKLERNINIADENFNLNKKHAKAICDEIIKRKLDITLTAVNGFHVRGIDKELMKKMKKAGCKEVWFGIESGNSKILKRIKKGITKDMVRHAVKISKEVGIETVGGHFIIGLEGETLETVRDTIKFMKELRLDVGGFNQATPLPGTELWDYVKKHGRFLFDFEEVTNYQNFKMTNTLPQFETPEFTRQERMKAYDEAIYELDKMLRRHALRPKNILKNLREIRSYEDLRWAVSRFKNIMLEKDIRRQWQPKPK